MIAETLGGTFEIGYERLVVALGAVPRTFPVPGLRGVRPRVQGRRRRDRAAQPLLRSLESAAARLDPDEAERDLGFVFVGAGYAGVEALAELDDLARDAVRALPDAAATSRSAGCSSTPPRRILADIPRRLGEYTHAPPRAARDRDPRRDDARVVRRREAASCPTATRIPAHTLVWTAGVRASPHLERLGLPLDERGRVLVEPTLQVTGCDDVWALGDCAAVPNARHARARSIRRPASTRSGRRGGSRRTSPGATEALRLPDARPGRDARPLQGDRRVPGLPRCAASPAGSSRGRTTSTRCRLVRRKAARRHGLDGLALLPARHRRALRARHPTASPADDS